ncbi:hypothetical protein NONO_c36240 [Nocardia nova SH22a]|uniref:Cupin domain-containing protein n=1 Tax=Nocardia nova SH22a TaxID=1415166 RepID=W5TMG8_9NOCA|nr:cupin domain-containing protein [Nocardia nova]AHH18411.1 hypothetical protein NONO_c36240 [Nocardia nova SH22a]
MTSIDAAAGDVDDLAPDGARRSKSKRGRFEIFTAPELLPPPTLDQIPDEAAEQYLSLFDYSHLVDEDHPEAEVRESVKELGRASIPAAMSTALFDQGGPDGMSLVWVWFAPNYQLFRHGHPPLGDCLYFVISGSLHLGHTVLGPGDGFFVPAGMLYRYRAGSEGVQVLEFRAGVDEPLGTPGSFKLGEPTLEAVRKLTDALTEQHEAWATCPKPSRVGEDTPPDH